MDPLLNIDGMFSSFVSFDIVQDDVCFHTGQCLTSFEGQILNRFVSYDLPSMSLKLLLDVKIMKRAPKALFDDKAFHRNLTRTKRSQTIKSVVYAAFVRQIIVKEHRRLPPEEVLESFPFFQSEHLRPTQKDETVFLRGFIRAILTLLDVGLPARNNKHLFLLVGAMLEGSRQSYATGGSPSKATLRRLSLFEHITGCLSRKRSVVSSSISSSSSSSSCGGLVLTSSVSQIDTDESEANDHELPNAKRSSWKDESSIDFTVDLTKPV
jgi:hypothetical protein